ncbi:MAG: S-adenosylmethionine decarboxylase [Acidobacteriota bacterium]|jgi:S-adenosylmethionine/arginine decarboxylase-like enzyme|nr:S-adenosylmethionine decarboxylase [Acidobacteriota bacterium]
MKQSTPDFKQEYERREAWGLLTSLDIHDCNSETIRDPEAIRRFVIELCDLIEMKRFGEPLIVDFGEDPRVSGYSLTQLIETSLISAHFANASNAVYLDIFSCKYYDPEVAARFSADFFGGRIANQNVVIRK